MKRIFILALLLSLASSHGFGADKALSKAPAPAVVALKDSDFNWKKSCDTDGLSIYWSKVEGSQVIALKGDGIVNQPLDKVASVIVDTTRGTEWIDSLVASKVVRPVNDTEFIEYDHVGIPFPFDTVISDRDFVTHVTVDYDPATQRLTVIYLPVEDGLAPVLKKYTRGMMTCMFKLVPMSMSDQTYVEAEVHCDPRGSIPKWLVNFFQQDWPQTTFENLRKEVKKPDIKVIPMVANLLQKPAVKIVKNQKTTRHRSRGTQLTAAKSGF